jgi:hypothetical protein
MAKLIPNVTVCARALDPAALATPISPASRTGQHQEPRRAGTEISKVRIAIMRDFLLGSARSSGLSGACSSSSTPPTGRCQVPSGHSRFDDIPRTIYEKDTHI